MLEQSALVKTNVDLPNLMSFHYKIPVGAPADRQRFLAEPQQKDSNTKWEFNTAKNSIRLNLSNSDY